MNMTPEQVEQIAENVAEKVATKAVRATLEALGFDMDKVHEEQQVWAFARAMHSGSRLGIRAIIWGIFTGIAGSIAGWAWVFFGNRHS